MRGSYYITAGQHRVDDVGVGRNAGPYDQPPLCQAIDVQVELDQ